MTAQCGVQLEPVQGIMGYNHHAHEICVSISGRKSSTYVPLLISYFATTVSYGLIMKRGTLLQINMKVQDYWVGIQKMVETTGQFSRSTLVCGGVICPKPRQPVMFHPARWTGLKMIFKLCRYSNASKSSEV